MTATATALNTRSPWMITTTDLTRGYDGHKRYGTQWRKIRTRYVHKHPFCEMCMKEGKYVPVEEVHHIKPISEGGTNDESNLMSLCHSCHEKIHRRNISKE